MSTETTASPQDASLAPGVGSTLPLLGSAPEGLTEAQYLHQLAMNMAEWQHIVFNSADGGNSMGLRRLANDIQLASYQLRILLGSGHIEAKLAARIPLSAEEQAVVMARKKDLEDEERERQEDERRAESIRRHQDGLHGIPVPKVDIPQGRRAERSG
jgi:hypothetical protein